MMERGLHVMRDEVRAIATAAEVAIAAEALTNTMLSASSQTCHAGICCRNRCDHVAVKLRQSN